MTNPRRAGAKDTCCNGMCTCCPYGCTFVAPCILGIVAIVCTWTSTFGCRYFVTTFPLTPNIPSNRISVDLSNRFSVGPWTVENFDLAFGGTVIVDDDDNDGCVGWYQHDHVTADWIDAPIKFVRVISMLAAFASLFFWVPLMMGGCMVLQPALLKVMMFIFIFVAISSILTLVMLASDLCQDSNDCDFGGTGIAAILAFVFWIATAAVIPCMREKKKRPTNNAESTATATPETAVPAAAETLTNTVEQTMVEEDGTVVKLTTKTTTDTNGNKTITETREIIKPASAVAASAATVEDVDIPLASAKAVSY